MIRKVGVGERWEAESLILVRWKKSRNSTWHALVSALLSIAAEVADSAGVGRKRGPVASKTAQPSVRWHRVA
jgi:hypothetical protein